MNHNFFGWETDVNETFYQVAGLQEKSIAGKDLGDDHLRVKQCMRE